MKTIRTLAARDLSILANAPATYVVAVIFLLINGWLFASTFFQFNQSALDTFIGPLPLIFTFVLPALMMRSFSEEFRTGTIEYLGTLPLEDSTLVLAKYLTAMGLIVGLMAPTVVFPVILFSVGRPDLGQMVGGYLAVLGLASFYSAIGLWASATTRNPVVAFILGFFVCFFFFLLDRAAGLLPETLGAIVQAFSVDAHFEAMARGVLDTRDVLYWISGTLFFLVACMTAVQSRRLQ